MYQAYDLLAFFDLFVFGRVDGKIILIKNEQQCLVGALSVWYLYLALIRVTACFVHALFFFPDQGRHYAMMDLKTFQKF